MASAPGSARYGWMAVVPLAALLGGCAELGIEPPWGPAREESPAVDQAPAPQPPAAPAAAERLERAPPTAEGDGAPATPQVAELPPILPKRKPPPPVPATGEKIDLAMLTGLDEAGVQSLLGEPTSWREEAPAKIWHYVTNDCLFSVFFYLDLQDQTFRALSFEATKPSGENDAARRCLDELQAERRPAR